MLILLPPSEGKRSPARGAALDLDALAFPELTPTRERLVASLSRLCQDDPPRALEVLGLGAHQEELVRRNAELLVAPTARAERIYTGVLYDALDLPHLSAAARRRAARSVAITSALFGLLRPGDRIPAYRLSGDASIPGTGPVRAVWRDVLGAAVHHSLGSGLLVDLRSTSYAAFWRPERTLSGRTATVRVLHEHRGTRKVVSHSNKATKGRLVNALLEAGAAPRTPQALADAWRDLGWCVEVGPQAPTGARLDVVVEEV